MKNTFKLAAIAVSMALATSFVACSSGDDVVDASTPEYLLTAKTDSYIASLIYAQNVPEKEIESLKKAYTDITKIGDGCAACLEQYHEAVTGAVKNNEDVAGEVVPLDSDDIEDAKTALGKLKTEFGKDTYHKVHVYKKAIETATDNLDKAAAKVEAIGDPEGDTQNTILDGELNPRQSANMSAYLDAAAALKSVLSDTDKEKCKDSIKVADEAITAFNKLVKNKGVSKASINSLTVVVDAMKADIKKNVHDAIGD